MTLEAGTRLGPFEIVSPLGAGGMGEVYRARDTRLGREVALKVLPQALSASPELRQRLEREAKTISQLSHPHICTLHDVGHQDGVDYLVMELLEGETLADRLGKSGALPVEQALKIGIEIAGALDAAHKSGIVHRDLKPGNIMLTKSGVKLLDFGLAKLQVAPAQDVVSAATSLPTALQESQPLTTRGTILGTFQYMSPEQLEGREADARSDLFAFGCVLYEMLTGRKAFAGKSQASLIGSIMNSEPAAISSIQPMVPPALDRVVKGCLAKEPEERWHTAHDVMMQLQWIAEGGSLAGVPAPVAARRRSREKLAWGVAAAALLAALGLGVGFWRRAPKAPRTIRFEIATPPEVTSIDMPRISPDGQTLAFNATDTSGKTRIWVRSLHELAPRPLEGTEGTSRPFWSPDGRFLAFFAEGKLKKIEASGGPAQKICDAPSGSDGTWSPVGVILFDGRGNDPILRVSATGGVAAPIVKAEPSRKETTVGWPDFLPDGEHFLYMATGEKAEDNAYRIGSLDSKETTQLMPAQTLITYAPPGHVLFVRDKTLVAQAFDAKSGKTQGEPIPLAEHIGTDSVGLARFSVSREGTLVYRTGESGNRLLWVDRSGREMDSLGDPGEYHNPVFSPAGDRLAFDLTDPRSGRSDIWIRDLARGVNTRLTFGPPGSDAYSPLWSPDGKRIAFSRDNDLYEKASNGQGEEKLLFKSDAQKVADDWSRDGKAILFMTRAKETNWDIWVLPMNGEGSPHAVIRSPFADLLGVFSNDGRYIAYHSNESGRSEVYVQSYPESGGKWQISAAGGIEPRWRPDGRELYYRAPDQKIMAVDIGEKDGFQAGIPKPLFAGRFETGIARDKYLPSPDGQKFLVVGVLGRESITPITVVMNWLGDLGR
jgi:Tol biopolymer transport system component